MNKKASYTAASTFPTKLLKTKIVRGGSNIVPKHVQLNPTNICNLKCSFCSCDERDRKLSMDFEEIRHMMGMFRNYGCDAVTITGGGEPTLYPQINELIHFLHFNLLLDIGLTSNGTCLEKIRTDTGSCLTWARISLSDEREIPEKSVVTAVERMKDVDWAFSYVLSSKPNIERIANAIEIANKHRFTHIRIVSDMLNLKHVMNMEELKNKIKSTVDVSRVVFQERKTFTKGTKKCWISLLKPVVDAKGDLFPCCGTQYALDPPDLDYGENMKMGKWDIYGHFYKEQIPFDGSKCVKCYYSGYNDILDIMKTEYDHEDFV